MLSQTAQYALRTVLRLAAGDEARCTVEQLAEELDMPRNYLSKTLHLLARAGVVESTRGKHGGFRLRRAPHRITLREVVAPFEEVGLRVCLLGKATCSDRHACPAHAHWKAVSESVAAFFSRTTVAELLEAPGGAARPPRLTSTGSST
jgi:Rrf2 family transcriptional regulator, iron-sulfur cluster assembly transcription factor